MFINLEMILQDGGAHKVVFMVKGESGHKMCMECRNLYAQASGIVVPDDQDEHLTCSLILLEELDCADDDEVRGTVRRLVTRCAAARTVADRKLWETTSGFNNHPRNLLLDPLLDNVIRPVSNFAHDWMHTMVVHGVFNVVAYLLLSALMAVVPGGIRQVLDDLQQFVGL